MAMVQKLKHYADENAATDAQSDIDTAIADITSRVRTRLERTRKMDEWLGKNPH